MESQVSGVNPRDTGTRITGSMRDQISHENIHQGVSSILSQLSELDDVMAQLNPSKHINGKSHYKQKLKQPKV